MNNNITIYNDRVLKESLSCAIRTSAHSEPTAKISPRASVGAVNEKSPLIPRPIAPAAVVGRGRPGRTPALAPHLEVPEILIEDDANAVVDVEDDGLMLEYNRASCESGFNDHLTTDDDTEDDDDQVGFCCLFYLQGFTCI